MFCTNCGNKLEGEVAFCSGCGKAAPAAPTTPAVSTANVVPPIITSARGTKKKGIIVVAIAVIVVIAVVMFINNSGELSGTWTLERSENPEFAPSIQFSGNRFTATHYDAHIFGNFVITNFRSVATNPPWNIHRIDEDAFTRQIVRTNTPDIYTIAGEAVPRTDGGPGTQRYMERGATRITVRGTYSVTGDTLELLFSDGTIQTFNIQRTENTLDINRQRLVRR